MFYEIFRGHKVKLETMGAQQTIQLPLQRLEISSMKVFEPATDVPAEENEVLDAKGEIVEGIPPPPKYALGLLLELLVEYAPNFQHLKLEDCGTITSFPPGNVLCLWPTVYGIAELELIASSKDVNVSLLAEDTLPCLRSFLSRLPSLTHLHLEGFLESHSPASLATANMVTCAMTCPPFLAFNFMIQEEFPLIENVVWRWRGEKWKGKALVCRKQERAGEMLLREVWSEYKSL
ncbi:hypothetical protein BCR35DRAFT_308534 [Leucosporidium creatinivorum]|uniref:Uncharacterized protein n=1 Tax=Leucosporidium creatinivorum TaxID=106004 RepID=A0A1Y2E525_9BASI|nr:hypothetical protein BCR35DRAFT_308534 [Leucosporidium creatinivorum]